MLINFRKLFGGDVINNFANFEEFNKTFIKLVKIENSQYKDCSKAKDRETTFNS